MRANPARRGLLSVVLAGSVVVGCTTASSPVHIQALPSSDRGEPTASPSHPATSAAASSAKAPDVQSIATESFVVTLVDNLGVRSEPNLGGSRIGSLPADEAAFVVDGPVKADGHTWYLLASDSPCSEANDPRFHCQWWMGWVAGTAADGAAWLAPDSEACPSGSAGVSTFLGMTALQRLLCFGDASWTLRAYMAPVAGERGGTSIFSTEPAWLDAWGSLIFPQPEEREDDGSSALAMYAHPDLGCGFGGRGADCAFAPFVGQWVDIRGHLDDSAAATCVPIYNPLWVDSLEEPLPPLPDVAETVLRCRLAFVATDVQAAH